MPFEKGGAPGPGRPEGSKNKNCMMPVFWYNLIEERSKDMTDKEVIEIAFRALNLLMPKVMVVPASSKVTFCISPPSSMDSSAVLGPVTFQLPLRPFQLAEVANGRLLGPLVLGGRHVEHYGPRFRLRLLLSVCAHAGLLSSLTAGFDKRRPLPVKPGRAGGAPLGICGERDFHVVVGLNGLPR